MITKTSNNVNASTANKSGGFQIKATGKAFRILSDGLYSDKIRAIIRELSCNAYDAHVDANNLKTPFEVTLPTSYNNRFKIRDFGTGLSKNDVENIYTTYFESTKTDSNDVIGCLGLGCKSPFSYVNQFKVISFFDGMKYEYKAFFDDDDIPNIELLSEETTTEPNGMEISFNCNSNDYWEFSSKASSVFKYFKLHPKIIGQDVKIESVDYGMRGKNWGIRKNNIGSAIAIMGNVAYPMDDINSDLSCDQIEVLTNIPIDIMFDIGELDVAASRESLSYNKTTLNSIKARLDTVIKEIRDDAVDQIKNAATLWDARIKVYEMIKGDYSKIKRLFSNNTFEWNGIKVNTGYVGINNTNISLSQFAFSNSFAYHDVGSRNAIKRRIVNGINVTPKVRIFYNDMNTGSYIRCKEVMWNSNIDAKGKRDIDTVYLVSGSEQDIADFKNEIGVSEITPISSIVRDKKAQSSSTYNPMNSCKVLVYDENGYGKQPSTYWNKADVDISAGGIYVPIERYKICGEFPHLYVNRYKEALEYIGEDVSDMVIVGAKIRFVEDKLEDMDNWITLREYAKSKVIPALKKANLSHRMGIRDTFYNLASDSVYKKYNDIIGTLNVDSNGVMGKFINKCIPEFNKLGDEGDLSKFISLSNLFQFKIERQESINLLNEWKRVVSFYPMIALVDMWRVKNEANAIQQYINSVDFYHKNAMKIRN